LGLALFTYFASKEESFGLTDAPSVTLMAIIDRIERLLRSSENPALILRFHVRCDDHVSEVAAAEFVRTDSVKRRVPDGRRGGRP
jgi:hypothetical protein